MGVRRPRLVYATLGVGAAHDVLIRIAPRDDVDCSDLGDRAFDALRARDSAVDLHRIEFVGPQVGEELTEQGGLAMLFALGAIFRRHPYSD